MSIMFIVGVPRSGKTYRSVYKIWEMYKPELKVIPKYLQWFRYYFPLSPKQVYTNTYTNINQFDFSFSKQIKPLVFDKLYQKLQILNVLYNAGKNDEELISKSKELDLYDSLFVIDESHNFFDKSEDKVITWWFTYHGHLHQEIHLITQQIKLIAPKYKEIAEFFYKAYPSSNQVSTKRFRYSLHTTAGYHKLDSNPNIFTPVNQEVFKLYVSGKAQKRVNKMIKFYLIIPILILIVTFLFNIFTNMFNSSNVDSNVTVQDKSDVILQYKNNVTHQDKKSALINYKSITFIQFKCLNKICKYDSKEIPLKFLLFLVSNENVIYADYDLVNYNYTIYNIAFKNEVIDFLNRSSKPSKNKSKSVTNPLKVF